jgi:hypothetical protein
MFRGHKATYSTLEGHGDLEELDDTVEDQIYASVEDQLNAEPATISRIQNPFEEDDRRRYIMFLLALHNADTDVPGWVPKGYGLLPDEDEYLPWDRDQWIRVGKRREATHIILPEKTWKPRAIRWARALDLLEEALAEPVCTIVLFLFNLFFIAENPYSGLNESGWGYNKPCQFKRKSRQPPFSAPLFPSATTFIVIQSFFFISIHLPDPLYH